MTTTISLVMIVRNEESNIRLCLESIKDIVDEIVIVDTGSTDKTVEIAGLYTDQIYFFPWNDDFSAARNYAISRAHSQWILCLDADERLDRSEGDLRALTDNNCGYEAFFLPLHHHTSDSPADFNVFIVLRLFRNHPDYRFHGRIHEQVTVSRSEAVGMTPAPVIRHLHMRDKERNRKRGRNLALLLKAKAQDPTNPFLQYYLGVEWLGLNKADKALPCFQATCRQLTDAHILFRAPAVRHLLTCLKLRDRLDEAICVCLEESLRYPFFADLFFDGGILFEQKEDYSTATRWFQEAINCGRAPAHFSHTNGTESFLSLYHLGYCCEKLSRPEEAKKYYEQALTANPDYLYPLLNLLLLYIGEKGSMEAFSYLKASGHLAHPARQVESLATLFFEAGFAPLALACLEESGLDRNWRTLFRFQVYCGRERDALALLQRIRSTGEYVDINLAADEVIALILHQDYAAAKAVALSLWRLPDRRGSAWALLNLISLCRGAPICGRPAHKDMKTLIETTVAVMENCSRCSQDISNARYNHLISQAADYLVNLSPEGCLAYAAYLRGKAGVIRHAMEGKYRPARRLLPWG